MQGSISIERRLEHGTLRRPLPYSAFREGPILRVECGAGMRLYKLTDEGAVDANGRPRIGRTGFVTPWWFSYEPLAVTDPGHGAVSVPGIVQVVERASRSSAAIGEYLRSRGAVCHDWNVMTHLLVVRLSRPVVGLFGPCSGQPFYEDPALRKGAGAMNVSFIGGERQLFLPGLTVGDVTVELFGPH